MSLELVIGGTTVKVTGESRVEVSERSEADIAAPYLERIRALQARVKFLEDELAKVTTLPPEPQLPQPPKKTLPPSKRSPSSAKMRMGIKIRQAREAAGLTQGEVRRRANLPESMMSLYETGRRLPPPERLRAIEEAIGLQSGALG